MADRRNLRAPPQGQSRQCPHAPVRRCPCGPGSRQPQTRSGIPSARTGLPGPRSGIPVRAQQPTCAPSSGIQRSGYPAQRAGGAAQYAPQRAGGTAQYAPQRAGGTAQYAPQRAGGRCNRFPENTSQPSRRPPVGESRCPRHQQPPRTAIPVMQSRCAKPAMPALPSASTFNPSGHNPPAGCSRDHLRGGASTFRNSRVHTSRSYANSTVHPPRTDYSEPHSQPPPGCGRSYPQNRPQNQSCPAHTPLNQCTDILMRRIEECGGNVPDLDEEEMPEYMYSNELEDSINPSHEWC